MAQNSNCHNASTHEQDGKIICDVCGNECEVTGEVDAPSTPETPSSPEAGAEGAGGDTPATVDTPEGGAEGTGDLGEGQGEDSPNTSTEGGEEEDKGEGGEG